MRIAQWAKALTEHNQLKSIFTSLDRSCEWRSVAYEARPVLIAAAYLKKKRKTLIITGNYERALQWQAKLQLCGINPAEIKQLPSGISALFEDAAPEHIALSDRLGALRALVDKGPSIIIATPQAALERTLPKDILEESFFQVKVGIEIDSDKLLDKLTKLGYEHQEPVRVPGQYSQRGGIIDIFTTGSELPIRIELFGDEIESIRTFDPNTQRSTGKLEKVSFAPSRETMFPSEGDLEFEDMLISSMEREASQLEPEAAERLEELIREDADALQNKQFFDRLDLYRPLIHPDSGCATDLLHDDDLLILDEPLEIDSIALRAEEELAQALAARAERGEILHSTALDYMLPPDHLSYHELTLTLSAMNALPDWLQIAHREDVEAVTLEPYRGRAETLTATLKNYQSQGFCTIFGTDQPSRAASVLSQAEIFATEDEETDEQFAAGAHLARGNLGGGFVMPHAKLAFVSDAELFGVARLKLPQKRFMEGQPIATVLDLKPGDYIVHISFGIGVFRGLVKREEQGIEKEYLYVEYAKPDKLFVPADQLDRIQKYLNPGDEHPKLNKLTGNEWQRTLSKAKEDAKEFARELIKLYAQRKQAQRRPLGPDTPWQAEMETTFPWVETPSQLKAIKDTKKDLTQGFPMDRLVCGDVGFGKTEVAIRAAFKVVQAGRQVAVLCPTTILSEQHFRNFEERLKPFSVRIAVMNRFQTAGERRKNLEDLEAGKVDIVIGTHALLGKEIEFKDLGLVVIDEEQKFGVKQKEALKHLRTEIDVLSMSATPIPRTLSMALMDVRQMSLINDPPPGRLPIRTFVRPYSGEVVREALLRELARGGQVFYVYNRIESINHVAERLRKLVPTARIGVGHGKMTEKELEPIMIGFIRGEIDVLLSTTIIENGIDISNANTLLVENADRLGLSQLYQLRGRVGRSDRQAYAYLLYQSGKELTDSAMARLQALNEFSSLGSGYSLAFRDLQIRGAGELLGKKQHGTMATVGYELYTQMINDAVEAMKNTLDGGKKKIDDEAVSAALEGLTPLPAFELPLVALIPETYIKDQAQRLYFYQKMMSSRDEKTLGECQAEIEDRYGHPPEPVRHAFAIMALRMLARKLGIEKLDGHGGRLAVSFKNRQKIPARVFSILGGLNRECYLTRETLIWPIHSDPIKAIDNMLSSFQQAQEQFIEEREELGV